MVTKSSSKDIGNDMDMHTTISVRREGLQFDSVNHFTSLFDTVLHKYLDPTIHPSIHPSMTCLLLAVSVLLSLEYPAASQTESLWHSIAPCRTGVTTPNLHRQDQAQSSLHQSQASGISFFGVFLLGSSCWISSIVLALSTFKSQLKLTPAAAVRTQYPYKFGLKLTALGTWNIRNSSKRPSCTKSEDLPSFIRQQRWNPAHFTTGWDFFYFCPIASVIWKFSIGKKMGWGSAQRRTSQIAMD